MVLDVPRRYVERHADIDSFFEPFAKLGERGIDDPCRERMDDARFFGHRYEAVRRHQAVTRMVPPDERLDGVHGAGRQSHLRLVVEHQLALGDGAAQLAGKA